MTDKTPTRIADALEKLVDAYAQAQRRDHYALADRYAANEARQREGQMEDAWQARDWESVRRLQDEAEHAEQAECSRCGGLYAGTAEAAMEHHRACTGETPENPMGDPLDEDDHRDRVDADGGTWRMSECGYWRLVGAPRPTECPCWRLVGAPRPTECPCWQTLARVDATCGPLTFAPDAPPDAPRADLSASQGESGDEGGGEAKETAEPLLCGECEHLIDYHTRYVRCEIVRCPCDLRPSDIARKLIEQAGGEHG